MRLIIEVTDSERAALRSLCADLGGVSYSALVRALLGMAQSGAVQRPALVTALALPRRAPPAVTAQPKPAQAKPTKPTKPVSTLAGWDKR